MVDVCDPHEEKTPWRPVPSARWRAARRAEAWDRTALLCGGRIGVPRRRRGEPMGFRASSCLTVGVRVRVSCVVGMYVAQWRVQTRWRRASG